MRQRSWGLRALLFYEIVTKPVLFLTGVLLTLTGQQNIFQLIGPGYVFLGIADFAAAIGLWQWKRWGAYGLVTLQAVRIVAAISTAFYTGIFPTSIIFLLAYFAITIMVIHSIWKRLN